MSNQLITNKLSSVLTLAPLLDEYGRALVLQPKGTKNDTKEISADTDAHEIVLRVKKANWISVAPVGATPAAPPSTPVIAAPTPAPAPVVEPAPAPVEPAPVEPAPAPVSVLAAEETVQTTTVTTVETTTVTTDMTPPVGVEPPTKAARASRK